MLGELVFESTGKITSQRVLSVENGVPRFEISVKGTGILRGITEVTETWTYWNMPMSEGVTYGEGRGVLITINGSEMATGSGRGIGKATSLGKTRWSGEIFYSTDSKNKLAFLNNMIGINEDEVDTSGSYVHKLWEWK